MSVAFDYRVGQGTDIHRLVEGRPLILGGVEIPSPLGLSGHSDADALTHSIIDALLGATALGDIGQHFSDQDAKWKDARSMDLLSQVLKLVAAAGWSLVNVDSSILLQKPKLAPHILEIRKSLSNALGLALDAVSVKAGTAEGLGFVGEGLGIHVFSVVLLRRRVTQP